MKQNEIIAIVKEKFKDIHKQWPKLVHDFDMEIIHDFRVDLKKLRAFLRLLYLENDNKHPVFSNKIKTFYGYIGIIRNIQLQREKIGKYLASHGEEVHGEYITLLDNEETYWKEQTLELMAGKNFYDDEDKIIDQLPGKLKKATIKAFTREKLMTISVLISRLIDDDDIHSIRKIFKDLLYTWTYIEPYANMPEMISNEDALKKITTSLGDFRDTCVQLNLLYPGYIAKLTNDKEKICLNMMKKEWLSEKSKLKKKIVARLQLLHFTYVEGTEKSIVYK